ncbi:MAG: hypothetical protein R3F18_10035 [Lysobacterales bacterium]
MDGRLPVDGMPLKHLDFQVCLTGVVRCCLGRLPAHGVRFRAALLALQESLPEEACVSGVQALDWGLWLAQRRLSEADADQLGEHWMAAVRACLPEDSPTQDDCANFFALAIEHALAQQRVSWLA